VRRLIIRPGAIGDTILAMPAMEWLSRGHQAEVWVGSRTVPLIRFAERAVSIASTGLDLAGIADTAPPARLMETLRAFDEIYSWYGANRPEFRAAMAGLPFRFLAALPEAGGGMHAADFFAMQTGAPLPAVPRIRCARVREDWVAIQPFSGSASKNWPLDRFRELAARLGAPVRWCAGPEEELAGAERFEDLGELAGWLARARLYIGNDSGITHLAAAVGTPVLALFGPTDAGVWAPRGECVRVLAGGGAMERIAVSEALSRALEILPRSR
jgi:heptosyltransferase-3